MVQITVSGPEHSKKGYIMALITNLLRAEGADVSVIGEHDHLAEKFQAISDNARFDEHEHLPGVKIHISEMQTAL